MTKNAKPKVPNKWDAVDSEHEAAIAHSASPTLPQGALIGIAAVVAVATGVLGFMGGVQFQKGNTGSNFAAGRQGFSGRQGMGGMDMRNGSFGEVTVVSDSSITIAVRNFRQGSSSEGDTAKTYTINSSTKITVNGSTGSVSDIAAGDTVMIEADSSDSSIAASIRVGMGGGPSGQMQSAPIDSTSSST